MKQQPEIDAAARRQAHRYLNAYGADLDRWPPLARQRYGMYLSTDALANSLQTAKFLDDALSSCNAPPMRDGFEGAIIARYSAPRRSLVDFSSISSPFKLVPAGVIAGLGALGLTAGVLTAHEEALPPEVEAFAYIYELGDVVSDEEAEAVLWDVN